MPAGEARTELDEIAFRIVESTEPNAWIVAVTNRASTAASLCAEIEQLREPGDRPPVMVTIETAAALFEAVHTVPRGAMLVLGAAALSDEDWPSLDANRTRLVRDHITVLILDDIGVSRLENLAPNLASWIGGRVWRIADDSTEPELSPSEIDQRLAALEAWAGHSGYEMIRLAEAGELPRDPEYAEWLTLLGRADLLVH
jgi:hypothetical protein